MEYQQTEASFDVIVCGGGTAGALAAIAAARQGANTLLIEEYGFLGGTATAALVTPWMRNAVDGNNLNQGLTDELKQRLTQMGGQGLGNGSDGWFNPELLKYVLEEMAVASGVRMLYYTRVVDVVSLNHRVGGVVIHNKGGLSSVSARVVVDATGDADVAFLAGASIKKGRESDGMQQALSVRFNLANVDTNRLALYLEELDGFKQDPKFIHTAMVWGGNWPLESVFKQAVNDGVIQEQDGAYFQFFTMPGRPGELAFNCPRISEQVDAINAFHLTNAQITGKQAILRLVNFCRNYLPGCEEAYLAQTAPMVGIRESRRIEGEYLLTLEDVLQARKFADGVCRNSYPLDVHVPRGNSEEKLGTDYPYFEQGAYHEIPYRCLVPKKLDNLLVTGRCISASFAAQSSLRIQPNCHSLGEAAGVAAAMCIKQDLLPRCLDGKALRQELKQLGAYL